MLSMEKNLTWEEYKFFNELDYWKIPIYEGSKH